jgi:hypothetical protein
MVIFFILFRIQLQNDLMIPVKFKILMPSLLVVLLLLTAWSNPLKAQKNELEGLYYLMIFKTPGPVKVKSKIPNEVKIHLRAFGGDYQEWWLMESTSMEAAEKAIESIYKSFRIPVELEAHRVRLSRVPSWSTGYELSALRYKMLDYGIKMIDPTDNGYALIDALEDQNVEGIWMLTEQFEGFYISNSHTAGEVRKLSENHQNVRELKLKQEVLTLKVLEGDEG